MPPEHLFRAGVPETLLCRLASGRGLALFLDYDGTLTPIRSTPGKAVLPKKTKSLLRLVSGIPKVNTCIVTGRPVRNILKIVDLPGISYIGNHGLEIWHNGILWVHPGASKYSGLLNKAITHFEKLAIPGIMVEDKILSASVHYRNVDEEMAGKIGREAFLIARDLGLKITHGKKVYEFRPPFEWGKGMGILKWASISRKWRLQKIFFGDDITDEDGFRRMDNDNEGIPVAVGMKNDTLARYYVKDHMEVLCFLRTIASFKKSKKQKDKVWRSIRE